MPCAWLRWPVIAAAQLLHWRGTCDSVWANGTIYRPWPFACPRSVDGHLKFWKKMARGIEFVKHYKAHLAPFSGVAVSADGLRLCTTSEDQVRAHYLPPRFTLVRSTTSL